MLVAIDDSIWLAEGGIVSFFGCPYPTRMVVVRLEGAALWVWSPIALTPELRAEVDGIGAVAHLVSPNKLHHLYLRDWMAAYPAAALWGPQSSVDRHKSLTFREPLGDHPPAAWGGSIDQAWFRGSPFLDEVVFFHKPSSTVILADLSQSFSAEFLREHWHWWLRPLATLGGIAEGQGRAPIDWRLSFIRRRDARVALRKMLDWTPRRVVIAHGVWQRENGLAYLERAFAWLGPTHTATGRALKH